MIQSMRRSAGRWILVTGLGPMSVLGCGGGEHAAVLPSGIGGSGDGGPGAGGSRGGTGASAGGASSPDAGDPSDGSGGGTRAEGGAADAAPRPAEAGCTVDPEIGQPPEVGASVCARSAAWVESRIVQTGSGPAEHLRGSVTPDELTLAWMSLVDGVPTLRYADRTSANEPFPAGDPIFPGKGYYAADTPALSPDGLRIAVVRSDRKAFAEYTRTMRFTGFTEEPSENAFAPINELGVLFTQFQYIGDPVLSSDDRTLYYSQYDGVSPQTVLASVRTGDVPWMLGSNVNAAPLEASCGFRRRPTGISSDQLTLFYWDELSGTERATFRASVSAPFVGAIDLGARPHAQPNSACTRLYHSSSEGAADADVAQDVVVSSMR